MKNNLLLSSLIAIIFSTGFIFAQGGNPTIQNIINMTNADSLTKTVADLSGENSIMVGGTSYTLTSRHKNDPQNNIAADYIKQRLEYYGLTVTDQWWSSTGRNVFAEQPGTEFPNQKYFICAHYDDISYSGNAPGADDNASGTAAVLEAARIFANYSFPYTIVYALWDEEEQGLVGSDYFASQAAAAGDSILGVVNLDMIGWEGNDIDVVEIHTRPIANSYDLSDKMVELNTQYSIGLITNIINPGITASDHASFWDVGYSAILLIEDYHNDFNPYYHSANDLLQYFDVPYFLKCAQLALATTATFALNLNLQIQHTPFASTNQTTNMTLSADIVSGLQLGTGTAGPRLYYRVDQGSGFSGFYEVAGTPAESGIYNFVIPGQSLGTVVQYYLAAQDDASTLVTTLPAGGSGFNPPGSNPPSEFFEFYVASIQYAFTDDASNTANWTATGGWGTTTQSYVSSPSSFTDSPSGNYSSNANSIFTTNDFIDLGSSIGAVLEFQTKWAIEDDWDYGQVLVSTNGTSWTPMEGNYTEPGTGSFQPTGEPVYDGTQNTWVLEHIDLSNYIGSQIKIRFVLISDGYVEEDGWYIDDISIQCYSTVPVELSAFNYELSGSEVILNWSTATELNNQGFEIQRSYDNSIWQNIGFVEGNGTTSNETSYSFTDRNPAGGLNFYRIRQIDFNGTFQIYGPLTVNFTGPLSYSLKQNYPNPFNPSTTIEYSIPQNSFVTLKIFNTLGEEVALLVNEQKDAGNYKVSFNGLRLSSGTYIYQLNAGDFNETRKMMLVK